MAIRSRVPWSVESRILSIESVQKEAIDRILGRVSEGIPSAKIIDLTADKIKTGTIEAGEEIIIGTVTNPPIGTQVLGSGVIDEARQIYNTTEITAPPGATIVLAFNVAFDVNDPDNIELSPRITPDDVGSGWTQRSGVIYDNVGIRYAHYVFTTHVDKTSVGFSEILNIDFKKITSIALFLTWQVVAFTQIDPSTGFGDGITELGESVQEAASSNLAILFNTPGDIDDRMAVFASANVDADMSPDDPNFTEIHQVNKSAGGSRAVIQSQWNPDDINNLDGSVDISSSAQMAGTYMVLQHDPTTPNAAVLRSSNYLVGDDGWVISGDGSAEFNDITVRGDLLSGTYPASVTIQNGLIVAPSIYSNTSAEAANMYIDSAGEIYRSTSSRKYKMNIHSWDDRHSVLDLTPVLFNSASRLDDESKLYLGLIAEEVEEKFPLAVIRNNLGEPEAIDWNMITVGILAELKRLAK